MTLIVQSERWCEMPLTGVNKDNCTQCRDSALTICQACDAAVCEVHEVVCGQCGRSYCSQCEHACVAHPPLRKVA